MKRRERRRLERKEKKKLKKENPELYKNEQLQIQSRPQRTPGIRSREEREDQVKRLYEKLLEIKFYPSLTGVIKFKELGKQYILDGKRIETTITFDEIPGVELLVLLSPKLSVECAITVKDWKGYSG